MTSTCTYCFYDIIPATSLVNVIYQADWVRKSFCTVNGLNLNILLTKISLSLHCDDDGSLILWEGYSRPDSVYWDIQVKHTKWIQNPSSCLLLIFTVFRMNHRKESPKCYPVHWCLLMQSDVTTLPLYFRKRNIWPAYFCH